MLQRLRFGAPAVLLLVTAAGAQQVSVPPKAQSKGLSGLATPGHTAADTIFKLRNPPPSGGEMLAVTINTTPPWTPPVGATGFEMTLSPAETGVVWNGTPFAETFGLMLPAGYTPTTPPPLVVAWHGFGVSHNQIFFSTNLPAEANARGWMLMAPLGIADNTFGWLPGQQAVEKSLEWVAANYPFDDRRVYGVGFSMGAQAIANYAARHQDPAGTRFAALATVCGAFDLVETYNFDTSVVALLTLIFGGDPATPPFDFEYERVSLERMAQPHPVPILPIEGHSMARSLAHIPMYIAWSTDDTDVPYVPDQNHALVNYLLSLGASPVVASVTGAPFPHAWAVLDTTACFDFFATKVLPSHPTSFTILADRAQVFHDVTIAGATSGVFSRFDFTASTTTSSIGFAASTNVGTYTVNATALGLRSTGDFTVTTASADATGDTVVVKGGWSTPSKVKVDTVDVYDWLFDPLAGTTTLKVTAGTHTVDVLHATFDWLLAMTGTPVVGTSVTFDVTGGADGDLYVIAYSGATGLFPLTVVGDADPRSLLLDPATFDGVVSGTLSGGGQAHPVIPIPNNPLFVGFTIQTQAFTVPGATASIPFVVGRISNPLPMTFQ